MRSEGVTRRESGGGTRKRYKVKNNLEKEKETDGLKELTDKDDNNKAKTKRGMKRKKTS